VVNPSFPHRNKLFHVALIAVRCSKNSNVPLAVHNPDNFEIKSKGGVVRKTTLAAIAAEAGVSLPTVSKVVNGRPDVAPTTRARIEQLLDQHQYRRNGLRAQRRSGLIDLVFNGLDSPWAVEILRGVEQWGAEHSTAIAVSAVRHGDARPASWTSAIASHHSDGVILVTTTLTNPQVGQLRGAGIPLVVIDPANTPPPGIPSVGATNWAGGLAATEHLLSLGHRRIGLITGFVDMLCSMARLDGYRSALEREGVIVDPDLIKYGDFQHEGGFAHAVELLSLPDRPTAIFAGSDQQAFGVYEAARQRGLRIPDDLSVVGFDELPVSRWASPPLTTVRQPLAEMGSTAAQMLGELIDLAPLRANRVELSTELYVRESTAPPSRAAALKQPALLRQLALLRKPALGGPPAPPKQQGTSKVTQTDIEAWRDPARPADERVADLLHRMTLEEKIAQLGSVWMGASGDGDGVAPMQDQFFRQDQPPFEEVIKNGLGQLTRVFGTRPVDAAAGMGALASLQSRVAAASRLGIPAVAHEECLTGFATWGATIFPIPLAWGASFNPALIGEMTEAFGATMRAVGVHQGLAPVLDVTRDYRWGRTEETIGEDPYLVGVIGTEYVRGLQRAGVQATLKHFAAYAASRAGRNMAPVSLGPRELADVVLIPFEMALRLGDARSVMPSYVDIDGVPASADPRLLTNLLREQYGFTGVVVSDYYAVSFLELQHAVAASDGEAAALALAAGLDVELPGTRCFGQPLIDLATSGEVPTEVIDRAVTRVLGQKLDLGLLDPGWSPRGRAAGTPAPDLDPPAQRDIARRLAEESVILLKNDGAVLPLAADARVAVIGPLADEQLAFFGCYSMPRHLGHARRFDGSNGGAGVEVTTLLGALRAEGVDVTGHAPGCAVRTHDESGIADAVSRCRSADLIVAVVGDEAGLFGHGTSGEGCDAEELRLPGAQEELLQALADTGLPVVAVLVTGRPYALGRVAARLAAIVQAFFPGEEGGRAIAGVLTGRVTPSGRLPVEIPRDAEAQPSTYLRSRNAALHSGSSVDPTPLFAFGHGLSYTTFEYAGLALSADEVATDGAVEISCTVRNTGAATGTEVVQLYLSDPVASVARPQRWLAGFARAALAPGQAARVTFLLHADRTSFTGRDLTRVVEPGTITVTLGGSSDDLPLSGSFALTGPVRTVGIDRVLDTPVSVKKLTD
jgi:beta-xylosidase